MTLRDRLRLLEKKVEAIHPPYRKAIDHMDPARYGAEVCKTFLSVEPILAQSSNVPQMLVQRSLCQCAQCHGQ